jgi:hypothetical protein
MQGDADDPAALMQFARQTAAGYLKAPPLLSNPVPRPVPLPSRAAAE